MIEKLKQSPIEAQSLIEAHPSGGSSPHMCLY